MDIGERAAAREAPGDESEPSGFTLIRRVVDPPLRNLFVLYQAEVAADVETQVTREETGHPLDV